MDYIISALNGMNADYYVPGSFDCAYSTLYTQIDFLSMQNYLYETPQTDENLKESQFFNVTGTLSENLPDAIYICYTLPGIAKEMWIAHYE